MTLDAALDDADINTFVDGRMDAARAAAVARALAADPEARARVDGWRRQNESLRTLFASVLTEPVPIRLVPAPHPPRDAPAPAAVPAPSRLAGIVAATSIGAALAGFALGALASMATDGFGTAALRPAVPADLRLDAGRGAPAGLAARAAEAHRAFLSDIVRPVEVAASDEPKLVRWFQRRLGARLRVPDLAPLGWTLIGGRLVPDRHGAAGFLVYGSGADRLGLTVSRQPAAGDALSVTDAGASLGVATWGDADFSYALTSDQGTAWLERNAAALRNAVAGRPTPREPGVKP